MKLWMAVLDSGFSRPSYKELRNAFTTRIWRTWGMGDGDGEGWREGRREGEGRGVKEGMKEEGKRKEGVMEGERRDGEGGRMGE